MAPYRMMVLLCLVLSLAASRSSYVAAARIGESMKMKNRKSLGFKDSLISGYLPKAETEASTAPLARASAAELFEREM
ncbi:hypothetical protein Bca4012_057330 [Brassica carinata]